MEDNGVVLVTVVMIIVVIAALLLGAMVHLRIGSQSLTQDTIVNDTIAMGYAMGGIADARWRIRANDTQGLSPAGSFSDASYDPGPYYLNLSDYSINSTEQSGSNVYVDIYPISDGRRQIKATGLTT